MVAISSFPFLSTASGPALVTDFVRTAVGGPLTGTAVGIGVVCVAIALRLATSFLISTSYYDRLL